MTWDIFLIVFSIIIRILGDVGPTPGRKKDIVFTSIWYPTEFIKRKQLNCMNRH